jgi:hypothetical protein
LRLQARPQKAPFDYISVGTKEKPSVLALDEYHTGGLPSGGNHIRLATLFLGGRGKVWQIVFGGDFLVWAILVAVERDFGASA